MVISPESQVLLEEYAALLKSLNQSVNLISKHTEDQIWERHIEHCLTLARRGFQTGSVVVDWGTGGGLPAIPLAIIFPEVQFIAIDSVGKKIHAVRFMARKLNLHNLETWQGRAERWTGAAHYSVSRATAPLSTLWSWHRRVVTPLDNVPADGWQPGLICLKGGDLSAEIHRLEKDSPELTTDLYPLTPEKSTDISEAKYIVHVHPKP